MYDPKFIHLNVHSDYSIKDSLCKVNDIVKKAYYLGMPSISLTDFFTLSASIKFFKISLNYGIKPIIGSDICVFYENNFYYLTLLIYNEIGYKNLSKLISLAHRNILKNKFLYIDYKWICKFNDGLIILHFMECNYVINGNYLNNNNVLLEDYILKLKKYFNDRFYLQIFRLNYKDENFYLKKTIYLSNKYKLPLVATNKILFFNKNDFYIHKIRSSIYYGCSLSKVDTFINYTKHQYFKSEKQMCNLFKDIPESLYNSVQISKICNFFFKKKSFFIPKFPYVKYSSYLFLRDLVYNGFIKRIDIKNNFSLKRKYLYRIVKELKIINTLKISDYFLIVMEFVKWSKKNNIFVGPGRGSGAGSLVVYLLYITDIDPLKFDLIFERFLNFERISMPDLDIDFCMLKRDEVLSHIENIYGFKSVAQIVTFSTMTAKLVLRDVGRVLGYSYVFVDYIVKLIPFDFDITLKKVLLTERRLFDLYKSDIEVKNLIDISCRLEGIIKGIGKHAGGIVISPTKILDFCPIFFDNENNKLITQFDKNDIEYVGLVKFDLLGLRTLTVIDNAIKIINLNFNKNLDIFNISLNDNLVFNLLKKCETTAVFQLESKGMKDLIKRLKPDSFDDIIALLALFRPGPLQSGMVDNFINRKNGIENIYYPDCNWQHKLLIPILKCTYGIILYQEQVMQIAQVLANYNLGLADSLRMAISKKDIKKMNLHKKIFKDGSISLGINSNLSLKIFSLMKNFASYGFNKSHSVAYSFLAYQTLWLKTYYTSVFLISYMNADIDNIKKIILIIYESKRINIKIIPPNINLSIYFFSIDSNKNIIYGLGAIKGIGKKSINHIIKIRNKFGLFKDFFSFCILTFSKKVTRLVIEKLILSGSFDLFNINRSVLIKYLNKILKLIKFNNFKNNFNQLSLFKNNNYDELILYKKIKNSLPIWSKEYILRKEKEILGLYITDHPVNKYLNIISKYSDIFYIKDLFNFKIKNNIKIFGVISFIKFLFTKNNNRICVLNIDDNSSNIEVIVFKDVYNKYYSLLDKNNIIIVYGFLKFGLNKYNISLFANKIKLLNK